MSTQPAPVRPVPIAATRIPSNPASGSCRCWCGWPSRTAATAAGGAPARSAAPWTGAAIVPVVPRMAWPPNSTPAASAPARHCHRRVTMRFTPNHGRRADLPRPGLLRTAHTRNRISRTVTIDSLTRRFPVQEPFPVSPGFAGAADRVGRMRHSCARPSAVRRCCRPEWDPRNATPLHIVSKGNESG